MLHCVTLSERSEIDSDIYEYIIHTAAWLRLCQMPYLLVTAYQGMQVPLRIFCLPLPKLLAQPDVSAQSACVLQLPGKRHPDEVPRGLCRTLERLLGNCSTFGRRRIGTNGPRKIGDIHYRRVWACGRSQDVRKTLQNGCAWAGT